MIQIEHNILMMSADFWFFLPIIGPPQGCIALPYEGAILLSEQHAADVSMFVFKSWILKLLLFCCLLITLTEENSKSNITIFSNGHGQLATVSFS